MKEIKIIIPDTEEFDCAEQNLLAQSIKNICDNIGVNGIECEVYTNNTMQGCGK